MSKYYTSPKQERTLDGIVFPSKEKLKKYVELKKKGVVRYSDIVNLLKGNKHNVSAKEERTMDNIIFGSKKEMNRYAELKKWEKAGEIAELQLQPRFTIIEGFTYKGKKYRGTVYVADFQYYDKKYEKEVVEEVKGFETPVYKIKKKLFLKKYGDYFDFVVL